jgi:low temperature requirement protein LtrA
MVAGIVLVALGLKTTIAHVDEPLAQVPAFALCGGLALYLLGHVAFRLRNLRTLNGPRLGLALALLVMVPFADEPAAWVTLAAVCAAVWLLVGYEVVRYAEARERIRHAPAEG